MGLCGCEYISLSLHFIALIDDDYRRRRIVDSGGMGVTQRGRISMREPNIRSV